MRARAAFLVCLLRSAAAGQTAGLVLVPSEPLEAPPKPTAGAPPRPSRLEIKPPGNPIYVVEETEWDGERWKTARRPKVDRFSKDSEGVALGGYDVLSYLENRPVIGSRELFVLYGGVMWRFKNEEHRRTFAGDPGRYVPEYGGFCAYSVGRGYPAPADPRVFSVEGGKVYLFFNPAVKTVWEQARRDSIGRADRYWPRLHR